MISKEQRLEHQSFIAVWGCAELWRDCRLNNNPSHEMTDQRVTAALKDDLHLDVTSDHSRTPEENLIIFFLIKQLRSTERSALINKAAATSWRPVTPSGSEALIHAVTSSWREARPPCADHDSTEGRMKTSRFGWKCFPSVQSLVENTQYCCSQVYKTCHIMFSLRVHELTFKSGGSGGGGGGGSGLCRITDRRSSVSASVWVWNRWTHFLTCLWRQTGYYWREVRPSDMKNIPVTSPQTTKTSSSYLSHLQMLELSLERWSVACQPCHPSLHLRPPPSPERKVRS